MKVDLVGKSSFISKKSGKPCYIAYIVYNRADVKDGSCAEGKFIPEEYYDKLEPGKKYEFNVNFSGYIQGITEVK